MRKRLTRGSVLLIGCLAGVLAGAALRLEARRGAAAQPAQAPAVAAIQNGSFEDNQGDAAAGWRTRQWQQAATFGIEGSGHSGKASARIASVAGGDASWSQVVVVRPFARYRLSAWIKTEGVEAGTGKGALLNLHGLDGLMTAAVTGTHDWARVELEFDAGANDAVQVDCLLGGWGKSKGTAWFDDVQIEQLSARDLAPAAVVHTAQARAPMSKYIYGQFIEHLGRCIYGGIWAEILEDRKFYYPVGGPESPWKVSGQPSGVAMSRTAPFVGAQSPQVTLAGDGKAGGIEQGGLGLVGGRKYVGRIWLAGDIDAAPVRVTLAWGDRDKERQTIAVDAIERDFQSVPLTFSVGTTTDAGRLIITGSGSRAFRVGAVSLMPSDNVEGFRADTLQLLRELNAPVYRWPGGNFVSGYDWRDGLGDRDLRPPRKNPAWKGVEPNDVGIEEFMALCRLIGAEPYIAVNAGLGDAESAADEVEYLNGQPTTPMGRLRANRGHVMPYGCKFWSVGNEMYGDWQLGHIPLARYLDRHNLFARAMKAKDPTIRLVGVGDVGPWSEGMLTSCAANMSLISEHFYCQEMPGLLSHVQQIPRQIRRIAEAHRKYRQTIPGLANADIRIALDEWNYWYGPHVYGELGTQYFLKDALGIAAGLNEFSRQTDIVFMANYAQTVNVIGAIKTSKRAAVLDTTGVVLKLYRQHFGVVPVAITGAPEPLDVAAAWREDGKGLTIAIVNPTRGEQAIALDFEGAAAPSTARIWRVTGADEKACNEPGKPPQVGIQEISASPFGPRVVVPAMSVSVYELATTRK